MTSVPVGGEQVDRLRGELLRHPLLKGKPIPEVDGDESVVWLTLGGREVARIEERGRRRWWRGGSVVELRMIAHELVTQMNRCETDAVDYIIRAITPP